jgi:hypothetical protein
LAQALVGLRAELHTIAQRYAEGTRLLHQSQSAADGSAAELLRWEAAGQFDAASLALADLFVFLLRHARERRPELLTAYLAEALQPELLPIAEGLARLEGQQ